MIAQKREIESRDRKRDGGRDLRGDAKRVKETQMSEEE